MSNEMHAYPTDVIRKCTKDVLMDIVGHNRERKPKPHHMNKDIMTAILKMEREDG